uniref:Uncharacterized protein n=1 Tax=Streptomyces kanamyceticus TaxID=1967 RepID=E9KTD2_STRKN|nr:hypothetical protein Tcs_SK_048 [Streptomyces kanamyceticus]
MADNEAVVALIDDVSSEQRQIADAPLLTDRHQREATAERARTHSASAQPRR